MMDSQHPADVEASPVSAVEAKARSSYNEFLAALKTYSALPSVQSLRLVIFPDNIWIQRWDTLVLWMLLAVTFVVPYQLGVSGGAHLLNNPAWFGINVLISSVFFVDTFVYFFRAYRREPTGKLIFNLRHIRSRYMRTYFFPNLLSTVPSTVIFYSLGIKVLNEWENIGDIKYDTHDLILIKLIDLLKLIRLVRVRAIVSSSDVIRNIRETQKSYVLDLGKFVMLIVIVSHSFACIWSFVAFMEAGRLDEALLCQPNWIGYWYNNTYGNIYDCMRCCESDAFEEVIDPRLPNPIGWLNGIDRYALSLFWAIQTITSIGYGNISPYTKVEWWVGSFLQLLAGIMWAYVIGGLVGVVESTKGRANVYRDRIDQANDLAKEFVDDDASSLEIESKRMTSRIRRYIWNQKNTSKSDSYSSSLEELFPVLGTLSPDLRLKASLMVLKPYLDAVPYLSSRYMSMNEQARIATECRIYEYSGGEMAAFGDQSGQLGRGILVIKDGLGLVRRSSIKITSTSVYVLPPRRAFGEDVVLLDDAHAGSKAFVHFLTQTKVVFVPREAVLPALEKNKNAWKSSARWKYLKALILSKGMEKHS